MRHDTGTPTLGLGMASQNYSSSQHMYGLAVHQADTGTGQRRTALLKFNLN